MNVEELVRDSLREIAGEQPSAGAEFADRVLAVRRRRRTRRLAAVAAATVAVVSVSVAVPLLDGGKDDVRPAGVTRQDEVSAHPEQSPPRDLIAAGRTALATYYTTKTVPRTENDGIAVRTYWLLDPETGTYRKDTRWSYVAVAPGLKRAAVLEQSLPARRIGLLDLASGKVERWIPVQQGVGGVEFSRDGSKLVATTYSENPEARESAVMVAPDGSETHEWMPTAEKVLRTGFCVIDVSGSEGFAWWRVAAGPHDVGRMDFAFTRDGKYLYSKVSRDMNDEQQFYDLSGAKVSAPASERYLTTQVSARLSPNGKLAALGLTEEAAHGKSYSTIADPRTGEEVVKVRGARLLAWADDKRLIAWEGTPSPEGAALNQLVLVTIGSDKVVPLSGVSDLNKLDGPARWTPVFADR
ncbi:WD40 repeat domain-containing protein [Streptomyces sp. NPDC046909]|uniref:WD40 repeat domain-containing protein n=1 Tax=Streptomyces sp. NPDC046909 TaxID=3155617 RepID=UPI0033E57E3E